MKALILTLIVLFSQFAFARMDANSSSYPKLELQRMNMVRKARMLTKEYKMLQNRLKGWQIRKQQLIERFEEKNSAMAQMALGRDNQYGIRRAEERRRQFYASIDEKEQKIRSRVNAVEQKLQKLKENFLFTFAVELTDEEMFRDKVVRVKEKQKKIEIITEYINYLESYEKLRNLNAKYDQVENLLQSIAKIDEREKSFEQNLTKRAEENRRKMVTYQMMAERLREEFYNRYHMEIRDLRMARQFLQNLRSAGR